MCKTVGLGRVGGERAYIASVVMRRWQVKLFPWGLCQAAKYVVRERKRGGGRRGGNQAAELVRQHPGH